MRRSRIKQAALTLMKLGMSVALVWFFLRRVAWEELEAVFAEVRPGGWLLAVGFFGMSNLLGSFQWRALLRLQDIHLPVRTVVSLYFVGVFFNNFLVSNIGGDAVRIYDLKRLTGKGLQGFAATFLERFIGLFAMICFATAACVGSPQLWAQELWAPILALGGVLLGILCFGFSRRLSGFLLRTGGRVLPARVMGFLEDVRKSFMLYRHAYGVLGRVAGLAMMTQLCRVAVYYTVGLALGQTAGFQNYLVFIPLIAIVAALPISFGGIGVRENLGVLLFGRVGMASAPALAVMFLGYLAGIAASLAGGVLFVLRRSAAGKADAGQGAPDGGSATMEG